MDDLGRQLDSLTSAATRGVVVPPPDEVRRRARRARREGIGAGIASLAVVAIVVVALLPRGDSPAPAPAVTPTHAPTPTATPTTRPPSSVTPSTAPSPTTTAPVIPASALLTAADIGQGWTIADPPPRPNEVRFDPCGDGKLGPKPLTQLVQRYTSESGEVIEHILAYGEDDAPAAMRALRNAVDRCRSATPSGGAGKVAYVDRGSLDAGDDSLVLKVQGGAQDPITTYVTVVRDGPLVLTLQDTRVGEPYSETAHRALARKAVSRLP